MIPVGSGGCPVEKGSSGQCRTVTSQNLRSTHICTKKSRTSTLEKYNFPTSFPCEFSVIKDDLMVFKLHQVIIENEKEITKERHNSQFSENKEICSMMMILSDL